MTSLCVAVVCSAMQVANVMEKFIDDRRWARRKEDIQVLVTGQSLGGALSQFASLAYLERFPDLTVIETNCLSVCLSVAAM